ncbi:MAG: HNH endonuclease [Pirellulaceae bacterium]|nr:HNH endonuclease [Pirellulaceae bacterium]
MYDDTLPPTFAVYRKALANVHFTSTELSALRFQFSRPERSTTSQQLAMHLHGNRKIAVTNGIYGRLAGKVAKAVGFKTAGPPRPGNWRAISLGDGSGEHFKWIMRDEFARALIEVGIVDPETDGWDATPPDVDAPDGFAGLEGGPKLRTHLAKERSPLLAKKKKAQAASLACEVCGFDARAVYGIEYCEVHHLTPLSQLTKATKITLDELAIVCANCHRIIHSRHPEPFKLDEVRQMLRNG